MTFNFCGFFFLRIENLVTDKKKCLYYKKQQLKRCCDKQLVHITVILRSKNIFSSLESFQTLQLLNTHLVNFKFVLRNYFFTVFAIYFVDRKYEVNSWIDIGINFDIFGMYIFNVEFSYLII
jgi:membrane-associated HD superfamily phosphohydrolase